MTGDGLVQVAYLHRHELSNSFHESLLRLVTYDQVHAQRVVASRRPIALACPSGALPDTRNTAVGQWLDETPHEWLFWIDTDMGFGPDTVDRLVTAADPTLRPVVGALCFAVRELGGDGMGGRRLMLSPTLYVSGPDPDTGQRAFVTRWRYPADALVPVAGTGAACLLVHRSAAEAVRARFGDRWFDRVRYNDGRLIGEDLSFCARLAQVDVPIHVHTGVTTTHHKMVWFGPQDYSPPADAPPPESYDQIEPDPAESESSESFVDRHFDEALLSTAEGLGRRLRRGEQQLDA